MCYIINIYIFVYIYIWLYLLQYGRENIEKKSKFRNSLNGIENDEKPVIILPDGEEEDCEKDETGNHVTDIHKSIQNGDATVISREDLILVPDPELNYVRNNNLEAKVR